MGRCGVVAVEEAVEANGEGVIGVELVAGKRGGCIARMGAIFDMLIIVGGSRPR